MATDRGLQSLALRDFSLGPNLVDAPDKIDPRQVQDCRNTLHDQKAGVVLTRPGCGLIDTVTGDLPLIREFSYVKSSGTKINIVQRSDFAIFYSTDLATWTQLQPATAAAVALTFTSGCSFKVFEDMCWITNKTEAVVLFDGTYSWVLNGETYTGSHFPPGKATGWVTPSVPRGKLIELGPDRLIIANTTNNPSEIRISNFYNAAGNDIYAYDADAWPAVNQLAVAQDDGTSVTSINMYQGNLIAFKNKSMYVIRGSSPAYYQIDKIATTVGTGSPLTVKIYKNLLIFLGPDGIYSYNGATVQKLSNQMQPLFDTIKTPDTSQLAWLLTSTADFNEGDYGDSTSVAGDRIMQLPQTIDAVWDECTKSQVVLSDDSVITDFSASIAASGYIPLSAFSTNSDWGSNYANAIDSNRTTFALLNDRTSGGADVYFEITPTVASVRTIAIYGSHHPIEYAAYLYLEAWDGSSWIPLVSPLPNFGSGYLNPGCYYYSTETPMTYSKYRLRGHTAETWPYVWDLHSFELYEYAPSSIILPTIDFGYTPESLGNFAACATIQTGTSVVFQTRTSADGTSWEDWQIVINGGAISSTANRYLQWKAYLLNSGTTSPALSYGYTGAEWISPKKTLDATPASWGRLEVAYAPNSQTAKIYMRTAATSDGLDAASWVEQTPGAMISGVTLNKYIQLYVFLNTTLYSQLPSVDAIIVNYNVGSSTIQEACAEVFGERYFLSVTSANGTYSDTVIPMNIKSDGAGVVFGIFSGWNVASMCLVGSKLYAGSAIDGDLIELWTGKNDMDVAIDSWFTTKDLSFSVADNQKTVRYMWINADQSWDSTLNVYYSYDEQAEVALACALAFGGRFNGRISLAAGNKGKMLRIRFQNSRLNQGLEVVGCEIYYRVLPLRNLGASIGGGMGAASWTQATRPSSPYDGQTGRNLDFNGLEEYVGSLGRWRILSGTWTTATRPLTTSIAPGSRGNNTDTGIGPDYWNGTEWENN